MIPKTIADEARDRNFHSVDLRFCEDEVLIREGNNILSPVRELVIRELERRGLSVPIYDSDGSGN